MDESERKSMKPTDWCETCLSVPVVTVICYARVRTASCRSELVPLAIKNDDEHRIKLVYVCRELAKEQREREKQEDPLWSYAARRTLEQHDWRFSS